MLPFVHNITLVNSYQGIMMSAFSGSSVSDISDSTQAQVLGPEKLACELCSCYNLRLSSDYWSRLPEAAMSTEAAAVHKFMTSELIAVQVGRVDGLSFYNASLAESKTPVLVNMEKDEAKVMVAPWSQYGFGGGLAKVGGRGPTLISTAGTLARITSIWTLSATGR